MTGGVDFRPPGRHLWPWVVREPRPGYHTVGPWVPWRDRWFPTFAWLFTTGCAQKIIWLRTPYTTLPGHLLLSAAVVVVAAVARYCWRAHRAP